ncbi:hypothetical protein [Rhodococcus sp. I2R]|uniref:hypothetical protein n=1 Tax=Rhodococcus sp. I2R TaxID=2855445 RepID=UPI001E3FAA6E|nr:hypothetical protein [Rhodococcus sp. I2R]MCC8930835.1 hypothetical protein [Rhodococcus sp. I2R]
MASNTVDIYIKGHEKDLLRAIDRVKASLASIRNTTAKVTVDVDDGALRRLQAQMAAIRNATVRATVDVDSSQLARLRADLAALRDRTVHIDVELDTGSALAGLAAFDSSRGDATIKLDLDTSTAAAELAVFVAAVPRSVSINLDLNTATAAAELAAFRLAMEALNDVTITLGSTSRTASRGVGAMGGAASSALPLVAALAPAIGVLASGAIGAGIFTTAAALGAVTAAAGAVSVGIGGAFAALPIAAAASSEQVRSAFTTMKDDVVSTMQEIAQPVEEPLITLAGAVGDAFEQIRPSLDVVTAGAARLVDELSGEMPRIAAEVGPAMEKAFGAAEPHINNLIDNIPSYISAFGDFAESLGDPAIVAGAQRVFSALPGIISGAGDALVGVGERFNDTMAYLDSGALDGFTGGISDFVSELGDTDFSTFTSGLADASNAFGDFLGNIDGEKLNTALTGITDLTTALTNVGSGMTEGFLSLNQWVDDNLQFDKLPGQINSIFSQLGLEKPFDVPVSITPQFAGAPLESLFPDGTTIPATIEPVMPAVPPPLPPMEQTLTPIFDGLLAPSLPPIEQPLVPGEMPSPAALPPVEQPITPGEMAAPPPPSPVPVPVDVQVDGAVTVPPPPPVPISFDVTQPTLQLTPPPPVPITFNVTLPTITIPPPLPVPVSVKVDTASASVDLSGQGAAAGASFASGLAGSAGAVAGAAATMAAAASSVSVDLSGQGAAAGASFAAGLASQAGAVAAAAANLGAVAAANKGHYKGRKGIAADRIMLIPHGKALVGGFIAGMQSQHRALVAASAALAADVYKEFDDDLVPAIGLSGGMDIKQAVYVTVEAGLMADPVKVGREVRAVLGAYASAVGQNGKSIDV